MTDMNTLFRKSEGMRYYGGVLVYIGLAYLMGFVGLFASSLMPNMLATFLLAHSMILAAYMLHECAHNMVFRNNTNNTHVGSFLRWICGAAYISYESIRLKHFGHHVNNDNAVWFDYKAFFNRHPLVLKTVKMLEWLYIPAHDMLMHTIMIFNSFVIPANRNQRAENIKVILIRGGIFIALAIWQPKAALLYAIACLLMITVLRFMDGLQHKYPSSYSLTLFSDEPSVHKGDKEWEQLHTYSNPHVPRESWLNWFTLNFGFHNAHHAQPNVPWYELPVLHRQLYGDPAESAIPLKAQLRIFHKYRLARIMGNGGDLDNLPEAEAEGQAFLEAAKQERVYSTNGVSFLTPF